MLKKLGVFAVAALFTVGFVACGGNDADSGGGDSKNKGGGGTDNKGGGVEVIGVGGVGGVGVGGVGVVGLGGGASVEVSAEMKDFVGSLGSSDNVEAALKKHGVADLETDDMEMYTLEDAKVISTEKKGDETLYTFEARSGIMTRTFTVGWKGGKIVSAEDKGAK